MKGAEEVLVLTTRTGIMIQEFTAIESLTSEAVFPAKVHLVISTIAEL